MGACTLDAQICVKANVRLDVIDADTGKVVASVSRRNTVTNEWLNALLEWSSGGTTTTTTPPPSYFALGTGTGTAAVTDTSLFQEYPGTRLADSSVTTSTSNGYVMTMTKVYQDTDPSGTFTEAGIFDTGTATTTLSSSISSGTTTLPVDSATSPAVTAGQPIYISDSSNSEQLFIQTSASAGASSWQLTAGTAYAHNSGVTVYSYPPTLWAHVAGFSVSKNSTQLLTLTWEFQFSAGSS